MKPVPVVVARATYRPMCRTKASKPTADESPKANAKKTPTTRYSD